MAQLLALACMLIALAASALAARPQVSTKCGPIEGVWEQGTMPLAAFLGIPYGAPPTGPNRWTPAQPAKCWTGTLAATKQPSACFQWRAPMIPLQGQSEDCLYLNVFTPTTALNSTSKLPVYAWLYGGDNCFGSTTSYGAIERILTETEPAVLVTFNFRLAALGFLALHELSATDPRGTSGNYAITDALVALQWIQDNIASFGGDSSRVTLIGQSSGGTNILALLAAPAARGLFSAAISLSGSPNITMSLPTAEAQGRLLLQNTSCAGSPDVATCLRALPVKEILAATPGNWDYGGALPINPKGDDWGGLVIVDGSTVAMPLPAALKAGLVDVTLVIQGLQGELDIFPTPGVQNWTLAQVQSFFQSHFAPWGPGVGEGLFELYTPYTTKEAPYAYYAAGADFGVTCGTMALAVAAGQGFRRPVYAAAVQQWPSHPFPVVPLDSPSHYPFHMWDMIAGFGVWDLFSRLGAKPFYPEYPDMLFGQLLRQTWYSIAATGAVPASSAWKPINAVAGFPDHYVAWPLNLTAPSVVDFKQSTCAQLRAWGFDERFWWIN